MDYMNELYELCEAISKEIAEANEKIRNAGGKLTAGDVDYIDKLTHTLKSIKSTMMIMEDEDSGYSSYNDGGSYARGGGRSSYMRGGSYARGGNRGGSYARGGYTRRYSRDSGLVEELRQLMSDAPNEQIKREMQMLTEKIEQQM